VDQLIPRAGSAHQDASAEHEARRGEAGDGEPITFDLAKLAAIEAPERELLRRYIGMIQVQRGDFNGRVITVRNEDVRSLARVFERDEAGMRRRFDELSIHAETDTGESRGLLH